MNTNTKEIYLAGGCFWGTEHFFKQIEGVVETEVGFANGHTDHPTYQEVYTDETGYAETVMVRYNPEVVSLEFLLRMFFKAIDPVSLNRQGHDEGTRYRTGIYYTDAADLPVIDKVYAEEQQRYDQPLAVEKQPLERFFTAEEYHQDYLDKNPTGYCHLPQALFEFARTAREGRVIDKPSEAIDAIYGVGTVFVLTNRYDGLTEREAFILAECHEEEHLFHIIQITGLHSGYLLGYVKHGALRESRNAITYDELIEAIKFNFIGPDLSTLLILNDRLELADLLNN